MNSCFRKELNVNQTIFVVLQALKMNNTILLVVMQLKRFGEKQRLRDNIMKQYVWNAQGYVELFFTLL
jgi:hypothetical protein